MVITSRHYQVPSICDTRWCYFFDLTKYLIKIAPVLVEVGKAYKKLNKKKKLFNVSFEKGSVFMRQVEEMKSFFSIISNVTLKMEKHSSGYSELIYVYDELMNGIRDCTSVDIFMKRKMIDIMDHYYIWIDIKLAKCLYYVNYNADRDGPLNTTYMEDACIFLESYCSNFPNMSDIVREYQSLFLDHPAREYGKIPPNQFWKTRAISAELKSILFKLMCIPSSSASVERVFSMEKHVHTSLRNRLSDENVNIEMLLLYNSQLFEEIRKKNEVVVDCYFVCSIHSSRSSKIKTRERNR